MRLLLILLLFLSNLLMHAKQIEVCPTCQTKSLSEAVKKAQSGDEILLQKGIYKEANIRITKPIKISGGIDGFCAPGKGGEGLCHGVACSDVANCGNSGNYRQKCNTRRRPF